MDDIQKVIIKTLVYSDIFDYPLTQKELWKYAVEAKNLLPLQKVVFFKALRKKSQFYTYYKGFYILKQRQIIISLRLHREYTAQQKLSIAKIVSKLLSLIPTIRFVGITGTLSMLNTDREDDIDFFIIAQHNTIWITRLLLLIILECIGKRRKRGETKAQDKICVNLIIDEAALALPLAFRDIYTAHEVVQLKPLIDRNNTYTKFLYENIWVKKYLPNALDTRISRDYDTRRIKEKSPNILVSQYHSILITLNVLAKRIQLWYMKKQSTSEIITDTILAFYEGNMRKKVLKQYKRKLNEYEI